MSAYQAGILAPGPSLGRFVFLQLVPGDDPEGREYYLKVARTVVDVFLHGMSSGASGR